MKLSGAGFPLLSSKKNILLAIINPLFYIRCDGVFRWLDIGPFFCIFTDLDFILVHKNVNEKKNLANFQQSWPHCIN